jgi:hypothetical protein
VGAGGGVLGGRQSVVARSVTASVGTAKPIIGILGLAVSLPSRPFPFSGGSFSIMVALLFNLILSLNFLVVVLVSAG